jgi:tRNA (guanine-N7-)-methyltransferase
MSTIVPDPGRQLGGEVRHNGLMPQPHVTPGRPHHRFTDDGRRIREVLSYSRRGSRFTPSQRAAWETHGDEWVIPEAALDEPGFRLADWFGREAPLIVEIGSGVGEATGPLAAARPAYDVLALEVWRPGVAASLAEVAAAGAANVRFCSVDAVWGLEHLVAPGELTELWTFFPDPWPKVRHHKRRLVDASFAALVSSRLAPGGAWRLATDWADYADRLVVVLGAEPGLAGGVTERWAERPVTKFERKGVEAGRGITDLLYRKV